MRTHTEKNFQLPVVWKKVFPSQFPDQAHSNTHWRKTILKVKWIFPLFVGIVQKSLESTKLLSAFVS